VGLGHTQRYEATNTFCMQSTKGKEYVFHKNTRGLGYLIFSRMFPASIVKTKLSSISSEIDPQGLVGVTIYRIKHA